MRENANFENDFDEWEDASPTLSNNSSSCKYKSDISFLEVN